MATDQGADAWMRFSTDDLSESDRLAIWRETIARSVARIGVEPRGERFRSESATRLFGELAMSNISIAAVRSRRTRKPMRPIPVANPAVQLLRGYLAALDRITSPLTPTMRHVIATNVQDLVALAVGTSHESAEIAAGRGVRAARFAAIKVDVGANLGRDDLSAAWIAPRHGVSPSHVRRLFAQEGTTFGEFVLDYRLVLAHRQLRDPRLAGRTISAIAYTLGFGDLSYFNRSFRRRYGGVPSDIRAAARDGG
jgi:AraC-like DNA-binding protein